MTVTHPDRSGPTKPGPMRVVVADSQPLLRDALGELLRNFGPDIVIAEAADSDELKLQLEVQEAPDLVLLGAPLTGADTNQTVDRIGVSWPMVPVIVFADFEDPAGFLECFEHGVRGCIARSTGPEIFLAAVRLVLAGGTYVPPEVLAALRRSAAANPRHTRPSLTRRQMAVLSLLTRGMSNRQISVDLGVTEGTVKLHVHSILKALNVSNRTEAALVAIETALVPRDSRGL